MPLMKNLGLIVLENITWSEHAKKLEKVVESTLCHQRKFSEHNLATRKQQEKCLEKLHCAQSQLQLTTMETTQIGFNFN